MDNKIFFTIGGATGTGLTGLYVRTLSGETLGSPIALTEVPGAGGIYAATMIGSSGTYIFNAYDSGDRCFGTSDQIYEWNGQSFVTQTSGAGGGVTQNVADAIASILSLVSNPEAPSAAEIRTELDSNSTKLAEIKTIATGAKNASIAGL